MFDNVPTELPVVKTVNSRISEPAYVRWTLIVIAMVFLACSDCSACGRMRPALKKAWRPI